MANTASTTPSKNALLGSVKTAGVKSVVLGVGVTVVAFAAQAAIIGANNAISAGKGIVSDLKIQR